MGAERAGYLDGEFNQEAAMRIFSTLLLIWLVIGAVAAFQRGYFSTADDNCGDVGTIVVTVAAGPLNYFGANPKVDCEAPEVEMPQPSE